MAVQQVFLPVTWNRDKLEIQMAEHSPATRERMEQRQRFIEDQIDKAEAELDQFLGEGYTVVSAQPLELTNGISIHYLLHKPTE